LIPSAQITKSGGNGIRGVFVWHGRVLLVTLGRPYSAMLSPVVKTYRS